MTPLPRFDPTDLDGLIHDAMALWEVPGLAVGITLGDDLLHLKGYGIRDIDNDAPVTPHTQFRICSLTKSFTAAGLALLVDEGRVDWNTRVREILPDFQLHDPAATEEITLDDLLSHRIGLPAHDRIWSPPGPRSRQQMVQAMRYLEPSKPHRDAFQYSNLGYVLAGTIAEKISGRSWEDFTTERLLSPLGFTHFGFTQEGLETAADHAHPHETENHHVMRGKLWPMRATPAGGLNTCASDLTRWMRLLMSGGRSTGKQLITESSINSMMTPRVHIRNSPSAEIGEIQYGYGLFCAQYRGLRTVFHTGSQPGWGALMTMMPDQRIGVVVLTNREPCPVREIITYAVFDRLLSLTPIDWFDVFRRRRLAELQEGESEARAPANHPIQPLHDPLEDLPGEYRHPAYGSICLDGVTPGMQWNWRGVSGVLEYQGNDSYQLKENGFPRYPGGLFVSCEKNPDGRVVALRSPLEPNVRDIVFQRVE